jgi:hypothetical protein
MVAVGFGVGVEVGLAGRNEEQLVSKRIKIERKVTFLME